MATGNSGAGTASSREGLVGMEVSVQGTKRRRVGLGGLVALLVVLLGFFLFFQAVVVGPPKGTWCPITT